jgi:hypothetical protein
VVDRDDEEGATGAAAAAAAALTMPGMRDVTENDFGGEDEASGVLGGDTGELLADPLCEDEDCGLVAAALFADPKLCCTMSSSEPKMDLVDDLPSSTEDATELLLLAESGRRSGVEEGGEVALLL